MIHEDLQVTGSYQVSGSLRIPFGPSASRTTSTGSIFFDTDNSSLEINRGADWYSGSGAGGDETPSNYDIHFLVVAGGGGGGQTTSSGTRSAGGGGGGFRNSSGSYTGGGVAAETPLSVSSGDTLTITVGAGGATNTSGGDSSITGDNITDITSTGGGKGGGAGNGAPGDGGSGGGTYSGQTAGSGTTGQGYNGAVGEGGFTYSGGGGGGAGQAGSVQGRGGDGQITLIINTTQQSANSVGESSGGSVYFSGGGGGYGQINRSGAADEPGLGGGASLHGNQRNALANSGGAGAASDTLTTRSQCQGAAGVVILRMATTRYSGTTTGSPTVLTDGSDTILIFKSSGTYTT